MATGTIPLGIQAYEVSTGNAKFTAYKTGNVVLLNGNDLSESVTAGGYKNIWTVPQNLRPAFSGLGVAVDGTNRKIGYCFYNTPNSGLYISASEAITVNSLSIVFIMQ